MKMSLVADRGAGKKNRNRGIPPGGKTKGKNQTDMATMPADRLNF